MADHGVIIDVGFQPDIKGFISQIEQEFKKINYDDIIGLSDSFDKQKKEVEKKIKELSDNIDEAINGKIGQEPLKQISELKSAVNELSKGFSVLVKALPEDQAKALASQFGNVTNSVNDMNTVLNETVDAIDSLSNKSKNVSISPINAKSLNNLKEAYRVLENALKLKDQLEKPAKKSGNKPYDIFDFDEGTLTQKFNDIYAHIKNLNKEIQDRGGIEIIKEENIEEADNYRVKLLNAFSEISRVVKSMQDVGADFTFGGKGLDDLYKHFTGQFDKISRQIEKRVSSIREQFVLAGGDAAELDDIFTKSVDKQNRERISVGLKLGSKKEVEEQISKLISDLNTKFEDQPIELHVKLLSSVRSKATNELLQQIRSEIKNIGNEEVSDELNKLLDKANTQLDNAFLINVNVATERATAAIKKFIDDSKDILENKERLQITPELLLSSEEIESYQKKLNDAGFKIDLNDFTKALSEFKAIFENDDSKLLTNFAELNKASQEIKKIIDSISKGKITFKSPIIKEGLVDSLEISDEDKEKIKSKINDISTSIKDMFSIGAIDEWSNYFITKLRDVFSELQSLIGGQNNSLVDQLKDYVMADTIMSRDQEKEIFERVGAIDANGKIHGFGTYDGTDKSSYAGDILDELEKRGITPKTLIHTHGRDGLSELSLPFDSLRDFESDLKSSFLALEAGIENEIVLGLKDITVFNAKEFFDSNKGIDFSDKDVLNDIYEAQQRVINEINENLEQYRDEFIKIYGEESLNDRNLELFAYRKEIPRIFDEALSNRGYAGNISKYLQTMSLEDFREKNPLKLNENALDSLFSTTKLQNVLDILDQITERINSIKTANKEGNFNNMFNLNINVDQISSLMEQLQTLIELLQEIPNYFNNAFSSSNVQKTIDPLEAEKAKIQKEIDEINEEISRLEGKNISFNKRTSESSLSDLNSKMQKNNVEYAGVIDIKNGKIYSVVEGVTNGITGEQQKNILQKTGATSFFHTHPEDTAAFDFDDIRAAAKQMEEFGVNIQSIISLNDIATLDLSQFSPTDLINISKKMEEMSGKWYGDIYAIDDDLAIIDNFYSDFDGSIEKIAKLVSDSSNLSLENAEKIVREKFNFDPESFNGFKDDESIQEIAYKSIIDCFNELEKIIQSNGNIEISFIQRSIQDYQERILKEIISSMFPDIDISSIFTKQSIEDFANKNSINFYKNPDSRKDTLKKDIEKEKENIKKAKDAEKAHSENLKEIAEFIEKNKGEIEKDPSLARAVKSSQRKEIIDKNRARKSQKGSREQINLDKKYISEEDEKEKKQTKKVSARAKKQSDKQVDDLKRRKKELEQDLGVLNMPKLIDENEPQTGKTIDDLKLELEERKKILDILKKSKEEKENNENNTENKYIGKTKEELQECLETEQRWLERCKEGSDAYNRRKKNIEDINSLLSKQTNNKSQISPENIEKARNLLAVIRKQYGELQLTKSGKFSETAEGKAALDDIATNIYKYSKLIGKDGQEINNFNKILGDNISDKNNEVLLKYYQNAIDRAKEVQELANNISNESGNTAKGKGAKSENAFNNLPVLVDEADKQEEVSESAKETEQSVLAEANSIEKVEKIAKTAAKSKDEFRKANENVADSAKETEENVNAEAKAMNEIAKIDSIDKQSNEFKEASKMAHEYFDELGDIATITKTVGTYNTYNKDKSAYEQRQRISYRVTDVDGNSRTFTPQGELIGSKDTINAKKAYDDLLVAMQECYEEQLKLQTNKGDAVTENKLLEARQKYADAEQRINELRDRGLAISEKEIQINQKAEAYNTALLENVEKYNNENLSYISNMINKAEEMLNSQKYNNNNNFTKDLSELIDEAKNVDPNDIERIKQLSNELKNLMSSDKAKSASNNLINKLTQIRGNISKTLSSNTKMGKDLRAEFESLAEIINKMTSGKINFHVSDVQGIIKKYEELKGVMNDTGQTGASIWQKIGNRITDVNTKFIAQYLSIRDLLRYIREGFEAIRELDTALVDLRKTTTMTASDLEQFYGISNDIARNMGVTTSEIIQQAANWSRLGYSSKEAAASMAELSSQFAAISPGMDVNTATDGLVSAMKAFHVEVDSVEKDLMDPINRLGNTMATTNEEIVQMLERSSAAMYEANNSINETLALESAAVQITRNAETTGTAFRTIAMRIRGLDEETEELSEDFENIAGDIAEFTKTASKPGGISLFTDASKTTYKSTYQLLKDISEVYDELTDKQQASLLEKLAGKRGGQVLAGIIGNFSEVERAMDELEKSAGSADKEMEIIRDSFDYKLNDIKESWVGFLQDLLGRDEIKNSLDALLNGSESLQKTLTALTPIVTVLINALSGLLNVISDINDMTGGLFSGVLAGIAIFKSLQKVIGATSALSNLFSAFSGKSGDTPAITGELIEGTALAGEQIISATTEAGTVFNASVGESGTQFVASIGEAGTGLVASAEKASAILASGETGAAAEMVEGGGVAAGEMAEGAAVAGGELATGGTESGATLVTAGAETGAEVVTATTEAGAILVESGAVTGSEIATGGAASSASSVAAGAASAASAAGTAATVTAASSGTSILAALGSKLAAIGSALASIWPLLLVIASVAGVVFYKWYTSAEQVCKRHKELRDELNETYNSLKEEAAQTQEISSSLEDLIEQYKYAEEGSEEYYNIANKIAELSPDLVIGYTDEGNAILKNVDALEQEANAWKNVAKRKRDAARKQAQANIGDLLQSYNEIEKEYKEAEKINFRKENSYEKRINELVDELKDENGFLDYDKFKEEVLKREYGTVTKAFEGGEEELVLFADTDISTGESMHDYMSDMAEYSKELAETNEQIHNYYIDILDSIDDSNERTVESNESLQNIRNIIIAYADEAKISAGQLKNIYEEAFNNDDFINIINDYYSLDFSDMPYEEAVSTIQEFINAIIDSSVFSEEDRNALLEALGFNSLFNKKQTFLKHYYADTDKRYYTVDKEAKKFIDENQQLTSKDYDILNSLDYRNALKEYQKSLNKATLSAEDYLKVLEQIKDTSEKIEKIDFAPYSKSGVINSITDNLTKGFDKLDEVYADVLDGEGFDFAKLATKDFDESFDGLKGSYEEFIETVSSNPESIEATQEAFDKLATSYIEQSEILQHLTEDNKEVAISMLEVRGVANAEEFVNDRLAKSKRDVALENEYIEEQNKRLVDSTMEEINAFVEENNKSEETRQELARLALQKQLANGEILNFDSDISNLKMFIEAIGGSVDVLAKFETAKAKLNGLNAADRGFASTLSSEQARADAEHQFQEAQKDLREYLNSFLNKGNVNVKYSGAEKTKSALDKANKSASDSREILDWIEVALQRVTESITRLGKIVSATYRNWSIRNNAIVSEMNEVRKQIGLQTSAYRAYLEAAEKIPLAENYKRLIREGGFFSEEINDKDLKKRIDEYKELYNKAIQAKDAIEDLNAQMAQLAKQKFDNVASEYDGYLADIEQRVNYINNVLSNVELRNKIAGKSFYQALMEQEQNHSSKLKSELSSLANALQDALSSGAIEYGSEEFNNMKSKIYEVENAIQESTNKIEEFKQKMKEVAKLDFDNIAQQFDNAINLITGKTDFAQNIVDVIEASGHVASIKFYEAMIDGANAQIESNKKKLSGLQDKLAEAMASGDIEKYDDQWYEMNEAVEETKKSIIEAASSVVEFANAMQQIEWDLFDRAQKGFSTLNDEAEYFVEMFKYNDIFEKESGALTEYGLATQGLYVQKYQTYKNAARKYADEIQKINDQLANDPTNTTLLDRYDDLLHSFWDATKAAEEEKEAIKDLVSDGFEILSNSIADIIDKYKEALQAKKDLYDYENNIEEQTGNINSIQKQLLAYQGDNSEETRATIQKLSSDLIKAQKQLEETEYEKYISDQEKLLDDFSDSLEEWINERLDNVDKLLEDAINATNNNSSSISNTIINEANSNCGIITNEMRGIWNEEEGLMSTNNDILYSTDSTCSDISSKIDSLPTSDLFSFYISDLNSSIISELSSVENVSREINYAISDTRYVLDNIKSVVEEFTYNYSSVIDNLGRNVVNAINAKQLSVSVHVDGYNSYSDTSGGGGPGYDPSPTPTPTPTPTPVQPVRYRVTNMSGTYDSAAQANAAARAEIERQLSAYKNSIHIPDTNARNIMIQRKKDELTSRYQVVRAKRGSLITSNASSIFDEIAKSIGEDHMIAAKEGERILTEEQNRNFEKLANNGFEPIDEDLQKKFTKLSSTFDSNKIDNFIDKISKVDVPNASQPINNNSVQTNVGDVNINLPNVTNKQEFVSWLRNDGQIEKIIQTMTIGKMAGGNSYDKLRI